MLAPGAWFEARPGGPLYDMLTAVLGKCSVAKIGLAHLTGACAVSLGVVPSTRILQQFRGRPIGESCCSRSRSEHPANQNRASAAIGCVQRQHSISLRSIGIECSVSVDARRLSQNRSKDRQMLRRR